jgi:hypothetical protein
MRNGPLGADLQGIVPPAEAVFNTCEYFKNLLLEIFISPIAFDNCEHDSRAYRRRCINEIRKTRYIVCRVSLGAVRSHDTHLTGTNRQDDALSPVFKSTSCGFPCANDPRGRLAGYAGSSCMPFCPGPSLRPGSIAGNASDRLALRARKATQTLACASGLFDLLGAPTSLARSGATLNYAFTATYVPGSGVGIFVPKDRPENGRHKRILST